MHAPLSWKVEQVGGYPVSITQMLPVSVTAGSSALEAHALHLAVMLDTEIWEQPSPHTALSTRGVWCQDQSILLAPVLCGKHWERHDSYVVIQNTKCGWFFVNDSWTEFAIWGKGFISCFYLLYNICTDFFLLIMKDKLTSGMPENLEVILFAYFVLVFGGLKKSKWDFLVLL